MSSIYTLCSIIASFTVFLLQMMILGALTYLGLELSHRLHMKLELFSILNDRFRDPIFLRMIFSYTLVACLIVPLIVHVISWPRIVFELLSNHKQIDAEKKKRAVEWDESSYRVLKSLKVLRQNNIDCGLVECENELHIEIYGSD